MIGSHNTMTYLPVRKWWMSLIKWTAKCQHNSIKWQYEHGARVFDFRIRCRNNNIVFAHGLVEYKLDVTVAVFIDEFITYYPDCTFEIVAEDTLCNDYQYDLFDGLINLLKEKHKDKQFVVVKSKKHWINKGIFGINYSREIQDFYVWSKKKFIPFPWLYYKLNKHIEDKSNTLIWKDFI